jgi:AcrR family transcriptional regulator
MPKDTFFNLPKEKQERIIDSAIFQFSSVHYNRVTIDNIVEGAGIPKGSFYQYFNNKDDLYEYIFEQIGDDKKHVIDNLIGDVDKIDFKQYVIKMLKEAERYGMEDSKLLELKNKFLNQCPQELRKKVLKKAIPKGYKILEEVVRAYIDKGELKEDLKVSTVAYMITSCILSLENYEFVRGEGLDDVVDSILDIIIKGIK